MGNEPVRILVCCLYAPSDPFLRELVSPLCYLLIFINWFHFQKYGPWVRSKSKYARNDGMPIFIVPPSSQEKDSEAEKLRAKSSDTAENLV